MTIDVIRKEMKRNPLCWKAAGNQQEGGAEMSSSDIERLQWERDGRFYHLWIRDDVNECIRSLTIAHEAFDKYIVLDRDILMNRRYDTLEDAKAACEEAAVMMLDPPESDYSEDLRHPYTR